MKKIIVLLLILFTLSACSDKTEENSPPPSTPSENTETSAPEKNGSYQKISGEEAKKIANEQSALIVDVRTEDEYNAGHVKGAILVPNESIGEEAPDSLPDKEAVLILYCRSGNRSGQAAQKLLKLGYKNIYDFGSINNWPEPLE